MALSMWTISRDVSKLTLYKQMYYMRTFDDNYQRKPKSPENMRLTCALCSVPVVSGLLVSDWSGCVSRSTSCARLSNVSSWEIMKMSYAGAISVSGSGSDSGPVNAEFGGATVRLSTCVGKNRMTYWHTTSLSDLHTIGFLAFEIQ